MDSKRGISPIIATVLLLGFSVALATTIFLWMSGHTEKMSESTVEYVEGEMQCQNIRMNVKEDLEGCQKITIMNLGYLNIEKVAIRMFPLAGDPTGVTKDLKSGSGLEPKSSQTEEGDYQDQVTSLCSGKCSKTEIMPIIKISEKLSGCKDKALVLKCEICGNTIDDDGDGLKDCYDTPACPPCP